MGPKIVHKEVMSLHARTFIFSGSSAFPHFEYL